MDTPQVITHVEISRPDNGDADVTPAIHQAVKEKGVLSKEILADVNDVEAK